MERSSQQHPLLSEKCFYAFKKSPMTPEKGASRFFENKSLEGSKKSKLAIMTQRELLRLLEAYAKQCNTF